jgi:hypothetical protein
MNMKPDEFLEVCYAEKLCDPIAWFNHARALIGTARIAKERAEVIIDYKEKSELENVCSMLYGLAIENILKATWIYQKYGAAHQEEWEPSSKFPTEIKTHDLTKLAGMVDTAIENKYKTSLKLLSESAVWAGRYPCSVQGEGTTFHVPSIHDDAEEIYSNLRKIFTISS